jgi:hypothetical protein
MAYRIACAGEFNPRLVNARTSVLNLATTFLTLNRKPIQFSFAGEAINGTIAHRSE